MKDFNLYCNNSIVRIDENLEEQSELFKKIINRPVGKIYAVTLCRNQMKRKT